MHRDSTLATARYVIGLVLLSTVLPSAARGQQAAPQAGPPPIWTVDGGLTRISDSNLNRFFTDFPVDAHHNLPDAAWRWTAGLKFQPRIPETVPLRFAYNFTNQEYENVKAFDFTSHSVSAEASLPKIHRFYPRLSGGFDWSKDSQGLTGNAQWASAGLDVFGGWLSAVRIDAMLESTQFALTDRNANQVSLRGLLVKEFAPRSSVFGQYSFTRNQAAATDFSYRENLGELGVIWRQRDWLEWSLRYQAHFRDYFDVDSRFGQQRFDILHDVYLNARFILVENLLSAFLSEQWETNDSNVIIKRYDAQIFSFGVQVSL